ncbi:MAG: TonB-dependent receptor [Flavobacteriaceae bacterium]
MKNLILLVSFLCTFSALGQNNGSISGSVSDQTLQEGIPYATIALKENDQVITGIMTQDNGIFTLKNLPLKKYTVEVAFIGYKTYTTVVDLTQSKDVDLGKIFLEEDAILLEGIEIVAEQSTIEQKIDRKVINVGRDLLTAGATASEIMNNIPTVNVDQDGNISLRGNQNVRVLVDGRPTNIDPAQLLKQIPSSSIKRIELITNPSAKYNPEGMSGIINIVLHKNSNDGFNGNFNAGITFGEVPKFNNSLNMNYRKGKVNFFGTAGGNLGEYLNSGDIYRTDQNSRTLIDISNDNESWLYKLGMDYFINDKNTVSFFVSQNFLEGEGKVDTYTLYPDNNFDDITQFSKYFTDNKTTTYNLAYKHLFNDSGHTLDFEGNFNTYEQPQHANFNTIIENIGESVYDDYIDDKRDLLTLNLDYVNPLSEKSKLELGAEVRTTRSENHYQTDNELNPNQASKYNYDMDIYSAYATFGQNFEKFSYQLGARFESFSVEARLADEVIYEEDYFTLYPSAFVTYSLNDTNSLQMSYSRRVDRPNLNQTKPIREFATPTVTGIGNPELDPQFTNSIELNYTKVLNKGSITAGVFYRNIQDEINRTFYEDEQTENPNDFIMSYANFDDNSAYGFEISANYKPTKWWDLQPAIDFSGISQKGLIQVYDPITDTSNFETVEVDANAFNARINNNFKVAKGLTLTLFGFYRGAVEGVQNDSKEMYKIDSGARYSMLDNKLTFSLRFNDMFNTMRYRFTSTNPFVANGEFTWESRTVYFGINYMFGGGKNRSLQRKYRDDNTKQGGGGLF